MAWIGSRSKHRCPGRNILFMRVRLRWTSCWCRWRPSEANDSRAGTKFIDVARLGAAGQFSDALAYDGGPQDAHPRLPFDERVWIEEILRLVDDPEMRAARAADIAAKVAQMSRSFAPLFPEL